MTVKQVEPEGKSKGSQWALKRAGIYDWLGTVADAGPVRKVVALLRSLGYDTVRWNVRPVESMEPRKPCSCRVRCVCHDFWWRLTARLCGFFDKNRSRDSLSVRSIPYNSSEIGIIFEGLS